MQRIRLRGGDHERIGEIAACAEGRAAIALSRGGAAKTYGHRHVNEDAAGFALGPGGALAVVADGHGGREAAELTVEVVTEELAPRWLRARAPELLADFPAEARAAAGALHARIVRAGLGAPERPCRTTLALALVRPGDDWLAHWSVGDSHAFEIDASGVSEPCPSREPLVFLGDPALAPDQLDAAVRTRARSRPDVRWLVLATDGLSERGIGVADPAASVAAALSGTSGSPADRRPLELARALAAQALGAQRAQRSGDNVAVAALWVDPGADDE